MTKQDQIKAARAYIQRWEGDSQAVRQYYLERGETEIAADCQKYMEIYDTMEEALTFYARYLAVKEQFKKIIPSDGPEYLTKEE